MQRIIIVIDVGGTHKRKGGQIIDGDQWEHETLRVDDFIFICK